LFRYHMSFFNAKRLMTLVSAIVLALAVPAIAVADGNDVIRDCNQDGDLDKQYSDEELEEAEENMPSDIDAYSSCREVIRQAQAGGRGNTDNSGSSDGAGGTAGGGGSSTGGGPAGGARAKPSDLNELHRREQEVKEGALPTTDDAALAAGADAGDDSGLPAAALVAIALLGLAAVGGGVYLLRDYLPPGLTSRLPGTSR
jgi:hypothetical protein